MGQKNRDFVILVPQKLVRDEMDTELRMGVLMSFCIIKRFSSFDGICMCSLRTIIKRMGMQYDDKKTKQLPKKIIILLHGLDYLTEIGILKTNSGDYHQLDSFFEISLDITNFDKEYVPMKIKYFDYILDIPKRVNKAGILYTLLFVLSCYSINDYGDYKERVVVCSYSLNYMSKIMGIQKTILRSYLNNLSIEEGYEGNAPLIKGKAYCIKIKERIIRLPNIFVENKANADSVIQKRLKLINKKMRNSEYDSELEFYFEDYDDLNYELTIG